MPWYIKCNIPSDTPSSGASSLSSSASSSSSSAETQALVDKLARRLAHLERVAEGRERHTPAKPNLVYWWQPSGPSCQGPLLLMEAHGIKYTSKPIDEHEGKYPARYDKTNQKYNYNHGLPTLQDLGADTGVFESATIMRYLADKFAPNSHWFPDDLETRTRINNYLDWQAYTLRSAFILVGAALERGHTPQGIDAKQVDMDLVRKTLYGYSNMVWRDRADNGVANQLKVINDRWLSQGNFIAGSEPSIADLALYGDCGYVTHLFGFDFAKYPKLKAWYERMDAKFGGIAGRREYMDWMERMGKVIKPLLPLGH
eukprot:g56489.t1